MALPDSTQLHHCSEVNCCVGSYCGKKPKIFELFVEEDKAFETEFSVFKALLQFGRPDWESRASDREVMSTVLKVDDAEPGNFVFVTTTPRMIEGSAAVELIFTNKFLFGSEDLNSRTLIHTMRVTNTAGDQVLGGTCVELTESQVTAKDAFQVQESGDCDLFAQIVAMFDLGVLGQLVDLVGEDFEDFEEM